MINQSPRGGTELQFEYLRKHVDSKLLDQVEICTSVPEKIPLSKDKVNILWQKNSYDQANLAPWFKNKSNQLCSCRNIKKCKNYKGLGEINSIS